MRKFHIVEFDRDYRTATDFFTMEFDSEEIAKAWCKDQSWSGYDYVLDSRFHS